MTEHEVSTAAKAYYKRAGNKVAVSGVLKQPGDVFHIWLRRRKDSRLFAFGFDASTYSKMLKEFRAMLESVDAHIDALDTLAS